MSISKHIPVRDTRDDLSELLKFGKPYPLQDVPLQEIKLKVPFNSPAKIVIEFSQKSVLYQLYHDGEVVYRTVDGSRGDERDIPIKAFGNGSTLILESYKIQERVSFNIWAQKKSLKPVENEEAREGYLHNYAPRSQDPGWKTLSILVEVGLDVGLRAWILDAPPIDSSVSDMSSPTARIINYGQSINVVIENSQEGVQYSLIVIKANNRRETVSVAEVTGNLQNISLTTIPFARDDDFVIRVLAVKTFAEEGIVREPEVEVLTVSLPVKIRANPNLGVVVEPSIVAYDKGARITVASSQATAFYQVLAHQVRDIEYKHMRLETDVVITVPVPNEADARIEKPKIAENWTMPVGYSILGDEKAGTGANLELSLNHLTVDSVFLVQARKEHLVQDGEISKTFVSQVQLHQAVVVLVEPNSNQMLTVRVGMTNNLTDGTLLVRNGELGIFYSFALAPNGEAIARPAYFHKRYEFDANLNKGLSKLEPDGIKTEVDFVIGQTVANVPNTALPPDPILDTEAIPLDAELHIRAMKAQSRVSVTMANSASLIKPVTIQIQDSIVNFGGETKILVIASLVGEKYQPLRADGSIFKQLRKGTGEDLAFNTDKLEVDTLYQMLISPVQEKGIVVERVVPLLVRVRPNDALVIRSSKDSVPAQGTVSIFVEKTQIGVEYQLLANNQASGALIAGTGDFVELPSQALASNTIFTVRAQRSDSPDIFVNLKQQVSVSVI